MSELSVHKTLISVLGALILVLLLAAVTHAGSLANTWRLATTRQAQGFYELYFTSPNNLPTDLVHGQAAGLAFGITDHELPQRPVKLTAVEIVGSTTIKLSSRTTQLSNGQSFSSTINFLAPASGQAYAIRISLDGTDQFIQLQGVAR